MLGEFAASLVSVRLAEAVPEAFGVNTIVAATLCPAAIVFGNTNPGRVNSELFTCAEDIVTGPFEAERVNCRPADDPTVILPKLRLDGETPRFAPLAVTPVPETLIISLGFSPLLIRVTVPVIFPDTDGVKLTPI